MVRRIIGIAGLCLIVVSSSLFADIRIKSNIKMEGLVGLMNMEGTTDNLLSGNKAKTVSNTKMTNKVMKFLGAGKPIETAEIIRLDKEVFWELEMKDKKYKEQTFAEVRADIEKSLAEGKKERAKHLKDHPEDTLSFKTTFSVKKTGKSETIAGHDANQFLVTMETYGQSKEGGKGRMKIDMDTWMAPGIGGDEQKNFYLSLSEKLGYSGRNQQSLEGVMLSLGIDPGELKDVMKELKGVSLRTITTITMMSEDQQQSEGAAALMTFTMTATEVSTATIPAAEFEVPEGFKLKK